MAVDTAAPAPPGVQTTFDKPLGPTPVKTNVGEKFREAFDKLTKPTEEPKHEESPPTSVETPKEEVPKEEAKAEEKPVVGKDSVVEKPTETHAGKPESPLDALLEPKEVKPEEKPDELKKFEEVQSPTPVDWKEARGVMRNQKAQIDELSGKLKSLETAPKAEPSVVEELTKQRDEFKTKYQQQEEKLKAINYQYSDKFQNMVADRENDVLKLASRIKAHGGDSDSVIAALALPEGKVRTTQIEEALAEVNPKNRGRIDILIDKIEEHDEKIWDETKNAAPKWDELVAQRDAQIAEQTQEAIKDLEVQYGKISEELPSLSRTFRTLPEDVPGAAEWNKEIKEALEAGLAVMKPGGADMRETAITAAFGKRYPMLEQRLLAIHEENRELKKRLLEFDGAAPDFKGSPKPTTTVEKKPGIKYREALAAAQSAGLGEM